MRVRHQRNANLLLLKNLLVFAAFTATATAQVASSTDDPIASAIDRLADTHPTQERVAAAQWLRNSEDPQALTAIDALATLCDADDAEVRNAGVLAMGTLCMRHGRECPLALIRAMFDADDLVRANAGGMASLFKKLPPSSVPILLEHAASPDPQVRCHALVSLGRAGGNNRTVSAVLRQGVHDRDVFVRTHAVAGLWHATGDLSQVVPHWLRFIHESRIPNRPSNEQAENLAAIGRQLAGTGAVELLQEQGRKHPEMLCEVLIRLLGSGPPEIRRGAAEQLAVMAADSARLQQVLKSQQVETALRKLRDDPNEEIRLAAAAALESLRQQPATDDRAVESK